MNTRLLATACAVVISVALVSGQSGQTTRQPKYPPFRSSGPVPEGAVAYIAMIVLVAFVFTFWRVDTPAARREEAVRRDEGERPG